MMFPGGLNGAEVELAAAEKVKNDFGTFITFGILLEVVAIGCSYFKVDGIMI